MGFSSTMDAVFTLQQLIEKRRERQETRLAFLISKKPLSKHSSR